MGKFVKIIIVETLVLLVLLVFFLFLPKQKGISQVCFSERCFKVEVADSPSEQERGLMFRENLEKDKGMLFVFKEEGNYPFWMNNTLIPLDIIWMNSNQEIVFIKEDAEPCGEICEPIDPKIKVKYALELNGGAVSEKNIKISDKMTISY